MNERSFSGFVIELHQSMEKQKQKQFIEKQLLSRSLTKRQKLTERVRKGNGKFLPLKSLSA